MVDALRAEQLDRVPYAVGTARLAGMDRAAQSRRGGAAKSLREARTSAARGGFVAVDRQRDDTRMPHLGEGLDDLERVIGGLLAQQTDAEADRRQPCSFGLLEAPIQSVDEVRQPPLP